EVAPEPVAHLAVQELVSLEILHLEAAEPVPDLVETVELPLGAVTDLAAFPVAALPDLAAGIAPSARCPALGQVRLQLGLPGLDVAVAALLDLLALDRELGLQRGQVTVAPVLVHVRDHVRGEVDDLFQVLGRQVEQVAETAGNALEIPDMRNGSGELDVAHPLTPDLRPRDLDPAPLADDPLEADPLVLTAIALPVPGGPEDLLAEEPVLLGLEGPVVDGLRLLDLTMRPLSDVVRGGKANAQVVEEVDVKHVCYPLG